MSVQLIPVHVTRTLIVPTVRVLIAVLVNKDLMEMVTFAKVINVAFEYSDTLLHRGPLAEGGERRQTTANGERVVRVLDLPSLFPPNCKRANQHRKKIRMIPLRRREIIFDPGSIKISLVKNTNSFFHYVPSDFDECSLEPKPCDNNATCSNTDGSFICTCKEGFSGNGTVCEGMQKQMLTLMAKELYNTERSPQFSLQFSSFKHSVAS